MGYFLRHSTAVDTLEGITRWRLMQQTVERTVTETLVCLRILVEQGLIEEIHTGSGSSLFRMPPEKRAEIAERFNGPRPRGAHFE